MNFLIHDAVDVLLRENALHQIDEPERADSPSSRNDKRPRAGQRKTAQPTEKSFVKLQLGGHVEGETAGHTAA